MSIRNKILEDIITALKSQEKFKLEVLRYINSQIKYKEIELKRRQLNDKEVIEILISQLKKLDESLEMFNKGNRQDLIDKTNQEIEILKSYLPKQMSEEELEKKVVKLLAKHQEIKNPGQLIGLAVKELAGKADNKRIAEVVMTKIRMTG
ncbi:hypothetical protein A3J78_00250 [Candidatus Beckwithbacteria bacterium RBG_13_35_6]|uniref:Glutamyl-tRNA amidotransferase n=1 Tax=Candidatus Beckwithbacteria bacterium RBG_13_35_6 TaxID=1797456 RepID=A0A1F5DCB3_9BACT|nr:MAG: hypothetical protein A3J78_00250 [Candidatus Beckwithbacteria bacterium RBG_13_35_6]